jgi:DNA-binding CsgD family transcriptional regulator
VEDALQFSALIGDVYNAALYPEEWKAALAGVCHFVGGSGAMIFWHDSVFLTGSRYHSWGDDPFYTKLYFASYLELNPTAPIQNNVPVGTAIASSSLIAPRELRKTRFFKEWMHPQLYVDNVFANLYRSATGAASIAVARHVRDGLVDDETLRRMQLLVPHVQRAVLIGKVIEAHRRENSALYTLADNVTAAILLLDSAGSIIHLNLFAQRMLQEGDIIWKSNDGTVALDRRMAQDIQKFTALLGTGTDPCRTSLSITGSSGKEYVVQLLALNREGSPAMPDVVKAVAAVLLRPAVFDTAPGLAVIAQRYRLTPREVDVLRGVVEIGGVPAVAMREGISPRTVKAHLHSVFAKTGTDRQADLVKLLASYSASF